jgi:prevent-host-death family protein
MSPMSIREARKRLGELVTAAEHGEIVTITRRGREVARLVPAGRKARRRLPDLTAFRASIRVKGQPLSQTLVAMRRAERY